MKHQSLMIPPNRHQTNEERLAFRHEGWAALETR
ncbi:hypothetical protein E2C01_090789 [Portunus trituberculatus]|uniref:Uncharacterized protein n=1 Tax=Portunus trituberculatus TaxID=210409 RepID=A0A5B7JC91_PORTR|nr:hypothetical protein [Portunus trituberculatus]